MLILMSCLHEFRPIPAPRSVRTAETAHRARPMPAPVPAPRGPPFNLDQTAPHPVPPPVNVQGYLQDAKDEYWVDDATFVFSTWKTDGGDARMTEARAQALLRALPPQGQYTVRIKFLRERAPDEWVTEDKIDPVREGQTRGRQVIAITRNTQAGALKGIDSRYYGNAYPVTAVVYGLYTIRDPNPNNLQPMRVGDLNCVAQRAIEHFEGALRGQGLTETRRQKIVEWEEEVHERGATVDDVTNLEKILKRAIVLRDIAGESIYDSGKYRRGGNGVRGVAELIVHNGHAWSKELHFPSCAKREVQIYEGEVWQAIRDATGDQPMAVWLLGGGDQRQLDAKVIDQFVLQDGRTFRTQESHTRISEVCR